MGKVDVLSGLVGVYCWFYSHEHKPPHFHAKRKGQWHIRVYFLRQRSEMMDRVYDRNMRGRISAKDRNAICGLSVLHREELLKEWEKKVNCND